MTNKNPKIQARRRRAQKTRHKISKMEVMRLTVHRTPRHIYAQLLDPSGKVVVAASTLDKELRPMIKGYSGNIAAAAMVGQLLAKRGVVAGIDKQQLAFDRSGFKYHGRIKALAEAAREGGLKF